MLWGIYSAIYVEVNVSVEKCVERKGDYVEKKQICFISVTLSSWSGRKLLDPTTYVCVTSTQACMCRCEGCTCVNHGLRAWIFRTYPFQLLLPMQFSNSLLLYRHTFLHAVCPVVLPGEHLLVVCKSHFPYLHYSHSSTIFNIYSEFPWPAQDSRKRNRTTSYLFATANFPFLT